MDEARRREQRERLELYLIDVFKTAHRIDLGNDAAAMRRLVDLAVKAQVYHEAGPLLGFEADLKDIAPGLDLHVKLTNDELVAVLAGKPVRRDTEVVREQWRASLDEEKAPVTEKRSQSLGGALKAVASLLIGGICVASFIYRHYEKRHKDYDDEKKTDDRHTRTSAADTAPATATTTPDVPTWVRVPSCTCIARGDSIKNTFMLGAPTGHESAWFIDWTQTSALLTSHRTLLLRSGDAGASAVLPPASGVDTLRLTLACDGDIAVLVSGNIASAWAGNDDGQLIWTTKLPAALAHATDAGAFSPSPMPATFDVACTQVLTATQGLVKLDLANGKHVSLSMHDGTLH